MTHRGKEVEFGAVAERDGTVHYWVEIGGVTVWRRSASSEAQVEQYDREQRQFLKRLTEEINEHSQEL